MTKKYYKVKEIAEELSVSKKTIFRYIQSGQLKAHKLGQWKIYLQDYKNFLNKHQPLQRRVKIIKPTNVTVAKIPLLLSPVSAGFPSPAEDFIEESLDLNKHLIKNKPATFLVRAEGDSMIDVGIHSKDILVVDRSLEPRNGKIVIAVIDGELTVKRISTKGGKLYLMPENKSYKPIKIEKHSDFIVWGVVTNVIHKL